MKLTVASQDRSADLGAEVAAAAQRRSLKPPRMLSPGHSALALKTARTEREFLDKYIELVGLRHGAVTSDFDIPRKPGAVGALLAKVRGFLWKLLRYQHDRMAFQQNLINELLVDALAFERNEREKLEKRMKDASR